MLLYSFGNIIKRNRGESERFSSIVRLIGLEPTRRETPDPKSGASTNFATGAWGNRAICDFALQR